MWTRAKRYVENSERARVHSMHAQGVSHGEIRKKTGLQRSTIQGIVKGPSSQTTRKGK